MKEERIWQLVGLKLSGEANAEELAELMHLLEVNPELVMAVEEVELAWNARSENTAPAVDAAFGRHLQRFDLHFGSAGFAGGKC